MLCNKNEIIEYFTELTNKIDIQCEKFLLKNEQQPKNDLECQNIDAIRSALIEKVQIIEKSNIRSISEKDKNFRKFCFFVPNYGDKIQEVINEEKFHNQTIITNEIGILIIINEFLNQEIVSALSDIFNGRTEKNHHVFDSLTDKMKMNTIVDVMTENEIKIENGILDLTKVEENILSKIQIWTHRHETIKKSDFNFIPNLVNLESIQSLKIRFQRLSSIEPGAFIHFQYLISLEIGSIFIETPKEDWFLGLENLLSLSIRRIYNFEKNFFKFFKNLKSLDLSYNNFIRIDNGTFFGLDKLEHLDLGDIYLKSIDKEIFKGLNNLKNLSIGFINLETLDKDSFYYLDKLTFLEINLNDSCPELKIHPDCLSHLKSLQIFYLFYSKLKNTELNFIEKLNNLGMLYIHEHSLENFIFLNGLKILEYLDLTGSLININHFDNLELNNLKLLVIDCEKISKFGSGFKNLRALEINKVSFIEKDCFGQLEKLDYLKLFTNKSLNFDNLNFEVFEHLKNFQYFKIGTPKYDDMDKITMEMDKIINIFENKENINKNIISVNDITFMEMKCCEGEDEYLDSIFSPILNDVINEYLDNKKNFDYL
ncbi:unnamed protein product [Brachionus calyciflorus]|uniref:Uncharacterized protein n=1 Tax=Brachionus calyciflorus TaxID=104777 RepID=A0A813XWJ8_9BILA|nr:unnamed protein product [Brachionus calyciflorus]